MRDGPTDVSVDFLTDEPVTSEYEDQLDVTAYADALALVINDTAAAER